MRDIGNGDGFGGHGNPRTLRLVAQADAALLGRRQVRQEYVLPDGYRPRFHIAHVENRVGKLFIKYARLDVRGQLFCSQLVDQGYGLADRARCQPQRGETSDHRGEQGECEHGRNHHAAGNTGGAHRRNLAVGGQPPQTDQDADQDAEWNAERQHRRQGQGEQPERGADAGGTPDQQLEILVDALQENDEGSEQRAEQRAGDNFAKHIPAEDPHAL